MTTNIDIEQAFQSWYDDPVIFAEDCLGVKCWPRQAEFMRAIASDKRVAVRSGHKTGKSTALVCVAIWWTALRDGITIYMSPEKQQIKENLYTQTLVLAEKLNDLGMGAESTSIDPDYGIMWPSKNRIFGVTANTKKKETRAGFSGKLLYIIDEASGVGDDMFKIALTAPNAKVVLSSNPTRNEGYYYDVFHDNQKGSIWTKLHISSREAVISQAQDPDRYQYLASHDWVNDMIQSEGEGSYHVAVRVDGNFATTNDESLIPYGIIDMSAKAWRETGYDNQTGPVMIGVDPARFGSDKTAIVWRRGEWCSKPSLFSHLSSDQIADEVRTIAKQIRRLTGYQEKINVNIDSSNANAVSDWLKGRTDSSDKENFIVTEVSSASSSDDDRFAQKRCEMWNDLKQWLRNGGQIPFDSMLMNDLKMVKFSYRSNGRQQVEKKEDLRKRIGRSTDAGDALCLSLVRPKKKTYHF
jgi:hypothetical protein